MPGSEAPVIFEVTGEIRRESWKTFVEHLRAEEGGCFLEGPFVHEAGRGDLLDKLLFADIVAETLS
ncbi:MAG: hypothetical protein GYA86_07160 [Firmicutes bacterium]|nr:hypothetical protein [Bacillota bacterium]